MRFASQLVQFGASEHVSRVNWFSSGLQRAFRESIGLVRGFRARFASQLGASERVLRVNRFSTGLQSANHLIKFGTSERISRVNWFSSGLQSAFRESIGSVRGFRARFASQLGASERVLRVNRFSTGLQSAERKSFD